MRASKDKLFATATEIPKADAKPIVIDFIFSAVGSTPNIEQSAVSVGIGQV